jgi:mRNA interferase RelE/StbE
MRDLEEEPRPHDSIKLKGTEHAFRVDVGEYRILYEVDYDAHRVTIYRLMQRGEGY